MPRGRILSRATLSVSRPVSLTIQGYTFTPVMQQIGSNRDDGRQFIPVEINGKKLYAIPGRLMAFEEDLPEIARRLTKSGGHSHTNG